jgi:hypothetical protein
MDIDINDLKGNFLDFIPGPFRAIAEKHLEIYTEAVRQEAEEDAHKNTEQRVLADMQRSMADSQRTSAMMTASIQEAALRSSASMVIPKDSINIEDLRAASQKLPGMKIRVPNYAGMINDRGAIFKCDV